MQNNFEQLDIRELHVKPTYAVCMPYREPRSRSLSESQRENMRNLQDNKHQGKLSAKATRRLANSVNWLIASAKKKYIFDKETNKRFSFKVNFITLTLPCSSQTISDHHFKSKLLHNFINTCRYKYGLKNFVWKVEAQANGNIHAHFTCDTFIHWKDLRRTWNTILLKNGLLEEYHNKHKSMTFEDYLSTYDPAAQKDINAMRKAFNHGTDTNWLDPNSTDIHAVNSLRDIAAYLASYMSKKEDGRRPIKGRLWGCSYNLSSENKLVIELHGSADQDILQPLFNSEIKYKQIEGIDKLSGNPYYVGEIFFYKLSDWGKIISGRLLQAYREHLFNIRHNIDIVALKNSLKPPAQNKYTFIPSTPAAPELRPVTLKLF